MITATEQGTDAGASCLRVCSLRGGRHRDITPMLARRMDTERAGCASFVRLLCQHRRFCYLAKGYNNAKPHCIRLGTMPAGVEKRRGTARTRTGTGHVKTGTPGVDCLSETASALATERHHAEGGKNVKQAKEKPDGGGNTIRQVETNALGSAATLVSLPILPQNGMVCNRYSPALSRLLDQATVCLERHLERAEWHQEQTDHHLDAADHHIRQAHRAHRIRRALERLVVCDG